MWVLATRVRFDVGKVCVLIVLQSHRSATQTARFTWTTWGPHGSCGPQVGPMLAPSIYGIHNIDYMCAKSHSFMFQSCNISSNIIWWNSIIPLTQFTQVKWVITSLYIGWARNWCQTCLNLNNFGSWWIRFIKWKVRISSWMFVLNNMLFYPGSNCCVYYPGALWIKSLQLIWRSGTVDFIYRSAVFKWVAKILRHGTRIVTGGWHNQLKKSYMGQVTKVLLSCYLVLLSNDSKTR